MTSETRFSKARKINKNGSPASFFALVVSLLSYFYICSSP